MRGAIALLITLFFIMAISVAIGIGLKEIKKTSLSVNRESFMIQSATLLDDVMKILRESKDLELITKSKDEAVKREAFYLFLSQSAFIPFESSGVKLSLEIHSARSKLNVNNLLDTNRTLTTNRMSALNSYLNEFGVNSEYTNILLDGMSGVKADMTYNSDIFNENPYLFRDYITSQNHLQVFNNFYEQTYRENSLSKVDFEKIFYFSKEKEGYKIDVNYITPEVWRVILGCQQDRAEQLSAGAGSYAKFEDLLLSPDEMAAIKNFGISYFSFFEPYIDVKVEVIKDNLNAKIRFEYNMKEKKGSNFVYKI